MNGKLVWNPDLNSWVSTHRRVLIDTRGGQFPNPFYVALRTLAHQEQIDLVPLSRILLREALGLEIPDDLKKKAPWPIPPYNPATKFLGSVEWDPGDDEWDRLQDLARENGVSVSTIATDLVKQGLYKRGLLNGRPRFKVQEKS